MKAVSKSHRIQVFLCLSLILSVRAASGDGPAIINPPVPGVPSVATEIKPGIIRLVGSTGTTDFHSFTVQWGEGISPAIWFTNGITLAGAGNSPVSNGLLATWDSTTITQADYYSLLLTVDDTTYTAQTNTLVYLQPDLYSTNWPRWLDEAPTFSMIPARNTNGQTRLSLVNPVWLGSPFPSRLWMFSVDGSSLTTNTTLSTASYLQPAVGNVNGAPGDEVIVGENGYLQVFRPDFSSYFLVPSSSVNYLNGSIALSDLDGDGSQDVVALGGSPSDAWLMAWNTNGQVTSANYPVHISDANPSLRGVLSASRIVAVDMDGDGKSEVLVVAGENSSSFSLRLIRGDGTPANWPTNVVSGTFLQVIAGDLDGDGKPEIVLYYQDTNSVNTVQVFNSDGSPRAGWPVQLSGFGGSGLLMADLAHNGKQEVIAAAYATLYVFNADGSNYPGWPHVGGSFETLGVPVVGDVDGDGLPEIVVTHDNVFYGGGQFYHQTSLVAFRKDGTISRSWQLMGANGNQPAANGTPVIGDFDGDGKAELAVNFQVISGGGLDGGLSEGVLTVLRLGTPYLPNRRDWPMYLHDGASTSAGFTAAKLRVAESGNKAALSWPLQPNPTVLQYNDNMNTGFWNTLPGSVTLSNGLLSASDSGTNAHRFYRLQYP